MPFCCSYQTSKRAIFRKKVEQLPRMNYDKGKYINWNEIFSKGRKINIVETPRGIGKTYGLQKHKIKQKIKTEKAFIFIVRSIKKKDNGILYKWVKKVLQEKFNDYEIYHTKNEIGIIKNKIKIPFGYCISLTEAYGIKMESFPNVNTIIFDEYQLEKKSKLEYYISGFDEPDLLLNIYDTVDRDRGETELILIGNNITHVNPYHVHPFFNLPNIPHDSYYLTKNICYYKGITTEEMQKSRENLAFRQQTKGTKYNSYTTGEYLEENDTFIEERSDHVHRFIILVNGAKYGVWYSQRNITLIISDKYDDYCKLKLALDFQSHNEETIFYKSASTMIKWFTKMTREGHTKFENQKVKKRTEKAIYNLL